MKNVLDQYIVPILQILDNVNVIIFENPQKETVDQNDSKINIISYDYDENRPSIFMYKFYVNNSYIYEPIIYSVNNKKIIIKRFNVNMLEGFKNKDNVYPFSKNKLIDIIKTTYPRGRGKAN